MLWCLSALSSNIFWIKQWYCVFFHSSFYVLPLPHPLISPVHSTLWFLPLPPQPTTLYTTVWHRVLLRKSPSPCENATRDPPNPITPATVQHSRRKIRFRRYAADHRRHKHDAVHTKFRRIKRTGELGDCGKCNSSVVTHDSQWKLRWWLCVTEGGDENDVFMFNLLVPFRMADARVQLVFNVRYSLSICWMFFCHAPGQLHRFVYHIMLLLLSVWCVFLNRIF